MLLEALIAILIFSMGILALVGLQAAAITSVSEAKYRSDAAFFANQIIGEMWVQRTNLNTTFIYPNGTSAVVNSWASGVAASLPGVVLNPPANPPTHPTIVIAGNALNGFTATVTVRWRGPNAASASNVTQTAFIRDP